MRVVLVIAATVALPIHAAAQAPAPTAPAPSTPAPASAPAPAPAQPTSAAPAEQTSAPGETPPVAAPRVDPAYGERPESTHDTKNFPAPRGKDVIIVSYPDRSKRNIVTLAGLGGGGVLLGALGLYFHMSSRSASDDISAHSFTGETWSPAHQDSYERAHSSAIAAGVLYGIGGGLLVATAIAYIATEPEPETMVIHPHSSHASRVRRVPLVAPTRGGAVVGGAWSF